MLWVWVMFSSLDLVRRNINRAVSDDMVSNTHSRPGTHLTRVASRARNGFKRLQQWADHLPLLLFSC